MARLKHRPSEPPLPPERGVKAATFRLLLDTAMNIIRQSGHIPSVAEVAVRSNVSRATAYRYFPSRSALVTAVIDSSLGPVRILASDNPSGRERVHELFVQTFPRFKEFEAQLRAAAQLSLEQWALERAGLLEEEPYRRGHRVRILQHAIEPLAPLMTAATRDRLHRALSVVYGIEPYVILKDIWGLPDREVERVALWMADALIDAALRESGHVPARGRAKPVAQAQRREAQRRRLNAHQGALHAASRPGLVRRAIQQPRRAFPSIRRSWRIGTMNRSGRARRTRRWSSGPTATTPPSGSTSSRRGHPARRCWSTSTAATGARWASATRASSRRRSSRPGRWWWCPATRCARPSASSTSCCRWCRRSPGCTGTRPSSAATRAASSSPAIRPAGTWRPCCWPATGAPWRPTCRPTWSRRRCRSRACSTWSRCGTRRSSRRT